MRQFLSSGITTFATTIKPLSTNVKTQEK